MKELDRCRLDLNEQHKENVLQCQMTYMMKATLMAGNNPMSNVASNAKIIYNMAIQDDNSEELCDENHYGNDEKENSARGQWECRIVCLKNI